MCLHKLAPIKAYKQHGEFFGWKIFKREPDGMYYSRFHGKHKTYPRNRWLFAIDYHLYNMSSTLETNHTNEYYPAGFHIYKHPEDAERALEIARLVSNAEFVIVKIYFRNIVATGYEGNNPIFVATNIFLTDENWH